MTLRHRLDALLAAAALTASLGLAAPACHNYAQTGLEALAQGDLNTAEREAREGLQDDPRDPALNLLLARVLTEREAWAEARRYADRALDALPEDPQAHFTYARIQQRVGSTVEAARHFTKALTLQPSLASHPDAPNLDELLPRAINSAADTDAPEAAVELILALQQRQPEHPEAAPPKLRAAREAVGLKLQRLGRYRDAADWYHDISSLYPDTPEFILEEGSIRLALQEDEAAAALFARFADSPDPRETSRRLALVGERAHLQRRPEIAEDAWRRALAADPSNLKVHLDLGALLFRQSRTDEGYALLRDWLKLQGSPAAPEAWVKAADTAAASDQPQLAIELLTEANANAAPSPDVAQRLADLLLRRDRRGDMEDAFKRYIERAAKAGEPARQEATLATARWLARRNELDASIQYYTDATRRDPKPELLLELARTFATAKRRRELTDTLKLYLQHSPQKPDDFITAASLLIASKQYDDALDVAQRGAKLHPDNADLHRFHARTLFEAGYPEREEKLWRDWLKRQRSPAATLEVGQLYARRLDLERARSFLEVAARNPDTAPEALLALGDMYRERGLDRDMRAAYKRYLDANTNDRPRALETLLPRFSSPQLAEDALLVIEELIQLKPNDPELKFEAARRYAFTGDLQRAYDLLTVFVDASPKPILAARKAGRLLENRGQHHLALQLYQRLLTQHANNPALFADLGELFWELAADFNRTSPDRADQLREQARAFFIAYVDAFPANTAQTPKELASFATRFVNERFKLYGLAVLAFDKAANAGHDLSTNEHLLFAEALLHTGDNKRAEEHFTASLKESRDKGERSFIIGQTAFQAGAWTLAERYLQRVLDKNTEAYVSTAFDYLAIILVHTGQRDRLEPLVNRYLQLTRATAQARLKAAAVYENAGRWDLALREYRDLLKLKPNDPDAINQLARAAWRAGDTQQARDLFTDAAKRAANPAAAWEVLGDFYLQHEQPALAMDAFNKAIDAGGATWRARIQRGVLLAFQGDLPGAQADFNAGLEDSTDRDAAYATILGALLQTPFLDLALDLAQQAVANATQPQPFRRTLAILELQRGDYARGAHDAQLWAEAQGNLDLLVKLLAQYDDNLSLVDAIRDNLNDADPVRAEALLLKDRDNLQHVLAQIGAARFPALYRPLFTDREDPTPLHRTLGLIYADLLQNDLAAINLAASTARAPDASDLLLGHLYLTQRDPIKARDAFIRYTARVADQPDAYKRAVAQVTDTFLLHDMPRDAERFVRDAIRDAQNDTLLLPVLTQLLLLTGQRNLALDTLRSGPTTAHLFTPPRDELQRLNPADASRLNDLTDALRTLDRFGLQREAADLLNDLAKAHPHHPDLLLARLQTAAQAQDPNAAAFANDLLQTSQRLPGLDHLDQLQIAEAFLHAADAPSAQAALLPLLASPERSIANRAFGHLAALASSTSDDALLQRALKAHTDAREDKLTALLDQGAALRTLQLHPQARLRYLEALKLTPGQTQTWYTLLQTTLLTGQKKEILDTWTRYNAVSTNGDAQTDTFGARLAAGPDADTALAWWSQRLKDLPAHADATLEVARLLALQGQHAEALDLLRALLKRHPDQPVLRLRALDLLAQLQRWQDLLDLAAPQAADAAPTANAARPIAPPDLLLLRGLAHHHLNQRDKALPLFDAYAAQHPDPLHAYLTIAHALLRATPQHPNPDQARQDARAYAERAITRSPDAPHPYLLRAQLRLAAKDLPGALQDLDAYLLRGALDTADGLALLLTDLLRAGATPNTTTPLLLKLANAPASPPATAVARALQTFLDADKPRDGLTFLHKHFPALAAQPQLHPSLLHAHARLLRAAGRPQEAIRLLEHGLHAYPQDAPLLRELALAYAAADQDLPRALSHARRALDTPGLDDLDHARTLDALATLQSKLNQPEPALQSLLLAIRLAPDDPHLTPRLYTHLASLADAAKRPELADAAKRRAALLDPDHAPRPLTPRAP